MEKELPRQVLAVNALLKIDPLLFSVDPLVVTNENLPVSRVSLGLASSLLLDKRSLFRFWWALVASVCYQVYFYSSVFVSG